MPAAVRDLEGNILPLFDQVASGGGSSCGVLLGELYCWGRGAAGQLGVGRTDDSAVALPVLALDDHLAISVGAAHACAVRSDGTIWCWGDGDRGQLGDGLALDADVPQRVALECP